MKNSDKELWKNFIKDVAPLKKKTLKGTKKNKTERQFPRKEINVSQEYPSDLHENEVSELAKNIDKNLIKKLRRSQIKVDAKIDLHGMKYTESRMKVLSFINTCYLKRRRLLLIITGKGKRFNVNDGWKGQGILKSSLPSWLSNVEFEKKILWFCEAPSNHGGEGAYVVYLRKFKE